MTLLDFFRMFRRMEIGPENNSWGLPVKSSMHFDIKRIPAELRLVLHCLRFTGIQDLSHRIRKLCDRIRDWDEFIRLAERHRVVSPVYEGLKQVQNKKIPKFLLDDLKKRAQSTSHLALAKSVQLVEMVRRLQEEGIPVLPFKGPVSGLLAYGDVGVRQFTDLDIMVAPDRILDAERILSELGFRRTHLRFQLTPKRWLAYVQNNHHFNYVHTVSGLPVELHWRFGANRYLFPIKFDDLWKDRQTLDLGGVSIPTFSNEHTMLLLCAHGSNHAWSGLFWLSDVAQLAAEKNFIDWPELIKISDRMGTNRMVAEGLMLAKLLLDSPMPAHMTSWPATDKGAARHMRISLQFLCSSDYGPYKPFTRQYFLSKLHRVLLRKDPRYFFVFAIRMLMAGCEDWRRVPLLDAMITFYLPIRVIRWLLRWYVPGTRAYQEGPMGQNQGEF